MLQKEGYEVARDQGAGLTFNPELQEKQSPDLPPPQKKKKKEEGYVFVVIVFLEPQNLCIYKESCSLNPLF